MMKVRNQKVLQTLSVKSLKSAAGRNFIAVIAIALTALLFTGVFTVGMSVADFMQEQTMRQVGTRAHGGFKLLTREQYEAVRADAAVRDVSYSILIGTGENPELAKTYTEIRYAEDDYARWGFCYPEAGHMPEREKEVVCSTAILDALGIPWQLGQPVHLEFTAQGVHYADEFILCGYYSSDPAIYAETAMVSKTYADRVAPTPEIPPAQQEDPSWMAGYYNPVVWFSSAWDIDGQIQALKERCGFGVEVNEGVNWAYSTADADGETVAVLAAVVVFILLAGYLIIYNIFSISVTRDIRFYGLLKTIGTTGRQLKALVYRQALLLSAVGIPVGLALGWLCGRQMIPLVFRSTSYANFLDKMDTSASPAIFVGGAAVSLFTVWLSCLRPCRAAAKVSPVEAVRWTGARLKKRKKTKKTAKVTPATMAISNMGRAPGKTAVVILSLTLSMIILNSVFMVASGYDIDKYLQNMAVSDYIITDSTLRNVGSEVNIYDGVSPADQETMQSLDGWKDGGALYLRPYSHTFEGAARERLLSYVEFLKTVRDSTYMQQDIDMLEEEGKALMFLYGADDFPVSRLEVYDGTINMEKFHSGKYILVGPSVLSEDEKETRDSAYYQVGETVTIVWEDGTESAYEVMAVAGIPYALSPQMNFNFSTEFILPSSEYLKHTGSRGAMNYSFDVAEGQEGAVQTWVERYCEDSDSLTYVSKQTFVQAFENNRRMIQGVGGALAAVLALIGILNFINSIATSIFTRRRELAMLQSVGMTGRQLRGMLMFEGLWYIVATFFATLLAGTLVSYGVIRGLSDMMPYFTYRFTMQPVLLCLPAMAVLAMLVPLVTYRFMCRDSVVERLREAE